MTGGQDRAKADAMGRWYKPAKCTRCGEEMDCLQTAFSDGVNAGNCPVRTPRGRCGGKVEFVQEPKPEKPKVVAIEVTDPHDVESELANLERNIGAVD